jgi:protein gp37
MALTDIEWSDYVWNPIRGCSMAKGSELGGCLYCYAARQAARNLPGMRSPTTGNAFAILTDNGPRWTGKVELIESKLLEPLHWRKPRCVFVNSMSDLFHENLPTRQIMRVFAVMALTPWITYQVLTKRACRLPLVLDAQMERDVKGCAWEILGLFPRFNHQYLGSNVLTRPWPLPNVHLGVSVENQACKHRIDELRQTPAALRFLSLEPLLEDLGELNLDGIGWVIGGGESGPDARPAHPDWFRSIRDQCLTAGVPFFFKQWGEWAPWRNEFRDRTDSTHLVPCEKDMYRVGKTFAGALLEGKEWRQMPEVHQC